MASRQAVLGMEQASFYSQGATGRNRRRRRLLRRRLTCDTVGQINGRISLRVFTEVPPAGWRSVGPAAEAAEAAGFDALMTVELGHDVLAPLAFAALATQRVELTPSIAGAFPRSPTVLASQAWDLQANSRGRFVLGLGSQVKGHNE